MAPTLRRAPLGLLSFALSLVLSLPSLVVSQDYGPPKGTLVIVGGGNTDGTGIVERFIQLAGGSNAKIVVVPTAGGNRNPDGSARPYKEEEVIASWLKRGVKNVTMLHTHDPKAADTEDFVKHLREATGVWFNGGRQWNIVDSYANTRTLKEFHKVLERGGVIGGSSAGATIQGDYLVRGAVAGSQIMMTPEPEHERGFNFLRRTAIDQHINTRNRWDDLIPVIQKYPNLLGIGLSEGTAIVVTGDTFEVIGKWMVAVHDNTRPYRPWEKPYYVLAPGDVYNMKTRMIEKYGTGATPPARRAGTDDPPRARPFTPSRVIVTFGTLMKNEALPAAAVTEAFFQAPVSLGRRFTPADFAAGASPTAILSHALWTTRFSSDRGVIGRNIDIDGRMHVIIGVGPQGWAPEGAGVLWTPATVAR